MGIIILLEETPNILGILNRLSQDHFFF